MGSESQATNFAYKIKAQMLNFHVSHYLFNCLAGKFGVKDHEMCGL